MTYPQQIVPTELKSYCIASMVSTVEGVRNRGPPSTALFTSVNGMQWQIFSKSTMHMKNASHEPSHAPFRGDFLSLGQDLI